MDEVQLATIRDTGKRFDDILSRQQHIVGVIRKSEKDDPERIERVLNCFDEDELEDLYLPYKQKRETRADKARKKGLEPLARMLMAQNGGVPERMAASFLKGDLTEIDDVINGAGDIIAEWISENESLRSKLRNLFQRNAVLSSRVVKGKVDEAEKYRDYFEYTERLTSCSSHRFLAIYRAARENLLKVSARPDEERALSLITARMVKEGSGYESLIKHVCSDSYKRLLAPTLELEVMNLAKKRADEEAIRVFGKNLRSLLLAAPLGPKRIMAIDPGFRSGCKVVCLDEFGQLLHNFTIFPHPPQKEFSQAKSKLIHAAEAYKIDAIAIGDGTAGRETEALIRQCLFKNEETQVFSVREDGASVYSASAIARKEFPAHDVTVRGAISIGRRLMDPLSELVKIDPKSIGVGQYQHEVDQQALKEALDDVVVSCVNGVGVDLNTASPYLLAYVSGLSMGLAEQVCAWRTEHGAFRSRADLLQVPRFGKKTFEQAAGFLRIRSGENPLDNSAVHPESYQTVHAFAKKLGVDVIDLIGNATQLDKLNRSDFPDVDPFTFSDLIDELRKIGRDPRGKAEILEFDHRLKTMEDLKPGMVLTGIVSNVTNFGAFVNIGIKENGLIHKSQLSDSYVEDPSQFISLHEHVQVRVLEVDPARKRIALQRVI